MGNDRRQLLGYIMRQQVKRAIIANGMARKKLREHCTWLRLVMSWARIWMR